ncbi:MAG TPA: glycoside hydrolase family 99-like domain-containing protein [Candidatus Onthousia faecigallinarum]|nr:glycoside hydrolase family 99-like domain-containing protein [Candidatus Onthousia faecigallinarum]
MIVPLIFESEEYIKQKPAYLWVFYKFSRFALDADSPIIATEEYFKKPSYYRGQKHPATNVMDYYGINDDSFAHLKKYVISKESKDKILKGYDSNLTAWVSLLKERNIELERILEQAIETLETQYEKIEALMVWTYLPSIDYVAKKHHITLINQEGSAIRQPFYNRLLNYFQFQNKYDTSHVQERYLEFSRSQDTLFLSRKELFALLVDQKNWGYLDQLNISASFEIGYGLGVATDCFAKVYSKWDQNKVLDKLSHLTESEKILIRPHPKEPVDLSKWNFSCDDSPSSFEWILKCKRIVADLSNVSFEAAFLGKTVISLSSRMPVSFGKESSLDFLEEDVMSVKQLNFLLFAWFAPEELTQDLDYVRWRLQNPSQVDIYKKNLDYILHSFDMSYQELRKIEPKRRFSYILEKRQVKSLDKIRGREKFELRRSLNMKDINSYEMTAYDYRKMILELEKEKDSLKENIEEKENEISKLNEKLKDYQVELNNILHSHSWKVTKPLRSVSRLLHGEEKKEVVEIPIEESKEKEVVEGTDYHEFPAYTSEYQADEDFSKYHTDIKTLAFYLPQFHTCKENDTWWGKGFMEWTNTKKAQPRFEGHYQPRIPHKDICYYTLDNIDTIKKQVDLAKEHGLYGFCFYYYWFSGKRLLEKPVDLYLEDKSIDFPFCFCWANENWTRTWDGLKNDILIEQKYRKEDPKQFIKDLKKYFLDSRYIRIDGKPLLLIYNPSEIPNFKETIALWRKTALEEGIGELYLLSKCDLADTSYQYCEYVDGEFDFPPQGIGHPASKITGLPSEKIFNYEKIVSDIAHLYQEHYPLKPFYYTATMGWDNSSRRKDGYTIYYNYSLEAFYKWLRIIIEQTRRRHDPTKRFMFINAWNEWAEGTYLEPDEKYGYANINTLSKAIFDLPLEDENPKE